MRYFEIQLPLPISINQAHGIGGGRKGSRNIIRSPEYKEWLAYAGIAWRKSFRHGIQEKFKGRIRVDYLFVWRDRSPGAETSDISNREKVLSDFLQAKFFENDNQIDEQHHYRRYIPEGDNCVLVRITEIPDNRREAFPPLFAEHEAGFFKQKAFDLADA